MLAISFENEELDDVSDNLLLCSRYLCSPLLLKSVLNPLLLVLFKLISKVLREGCLVVLAMHDLLF